MSTLRDEAARGGSVVAVMHDISLAGQADRCVILAHGAIHAAGPPAEVLLPQLLSGVYGTEVEVLHTMRGTRAVVLPPFAAATRSSDRDAEREIEG